MISPPQHLHIRLKSQFTSKNQSPARRIPPALGAWSRATRAMQTPPPQPLVPENVTFSSSLIGFGGNGGLQNFCKHAHRP